MRHFERMVEEWEAVDSRLARLELFMDSDRFHRLSAVQMELLVKQRQLMVAYRAVLVERIGLES